MCKLCVGACEAAAITLAPVLDSFVAFIEGSGSVFAKDMVAKTASEIHQRTLYLDGKLAELS